MNISEARDFSGMLDFFEAIDILGDMVISENSFPKGSKKKIGYFCNRDTYKGRSYPCSQQSYAALSVTLNW